MVDANRHVTKIQHADFVLNTPFAIIRTFNKITFKKVPFEISQSEIDRLIQPIKQYTNEVKTKPNIVVFITESFSREYMGAFNNPTQIPDYVSYTPLFRFISDKKFDFQ